MKKTLCSALAVMILFSSCSNYREGETSETSEIGKTALNRIDP